MAPPELEKKSAGIETTDVAGVRDLAAAIRGGVVRAAFAAKVGHIGSALSVADVLAALLSGPLRPTADQRDRNRFVLSKGHAALALYVGLREIGLVPDGELETYCGDGTRLGTHPEHLAPGIDFSTGSLGHGLSIAAGAALAARLDGSARRSYALLSDAECNEGSTWEAAMFAAHHRLGQLVALLDVNGQQALGKTQDVLDLEPLGERWAAVGWLVRDVDGHDPEAILQALAAAESDGGRPLAILCRTTFGRGVSFMESRIAWHYWPLSEPQYRQALSELGEH